MGTVYSTLGSRLDVVEMMDGLMQGADRDLVKVWQKQNEYRFDNIMINTKLLLLSLKKTAFTLPSKVQMRLKNHNVTMPYWLPPVVRLTAN